jgi:hypothetical protein
MYARVEAVEEELAHERREKARLSAKFDELVKTVRSVASRCVCSRAAV